MSGPADIARFPTSLATASAPGAMSSAQNNKLSTVDIPATGTVPAFVAGAASIAPGTDKAIRYVIAEDRTLSQASTLTLASTGTPLVGNKMVLCRALALGYALTIVDGPSGLTIGTIDASLTKPRGLMAWWDGNNYSFNGYVHAEIES